MSGEEERERLVAERDELLGRIAEVRADHAAGDLDDVDADALIDDLTRRAAEVLRQLDGSTAEAPKTKRAAASTGSDTAGTADAARRRRQTRLAWVAVIVVFALTAGVFIAQSVGRRGAGETFTGDIRQTTRDLLLEARDQWSSGDIEGALATYDEVLAIAPTNAEALTYSAWVARTMGGMLSDDEALVRLDDAVASDPDYADAQVFRAIILRDLGRFDEALAALEALNLDDIPPFLTDRVEALRAEVSGADPDTVAVTRAEAAARRGDVSGAITILDEVIARSPNNAGALLAKADVLLVVASSASGDDRALLVGNALDLVTRAETAAPDDPVPVLYRVLVLELLGRTAEARTTLGLLEARSDLPDDIAAEVDALRSRLGP